MSRFNPNEPNAEKTLAAAATWRDRCFLNDGSILSQNSLWTKELVNELKLRFVDNPDLSSASFQIKLKGQLAEAPPGAHQLMAEMLWLLSLFPSNIGVVAKTCEPDRHG
jgi:5-methylcytosine-specific restriction protein B